MARNKQKRGLGKGIDRRSLLLGTSALAQVPLLGSTDAETKAQSDDPRPRGLRYVETEHVRAFYERNRF